ncbi:calcium-binding protein [Paludibacterium purpuratum]|uniref:Hemolysin type calcium binding protein n=1 Tax=Paludibacterium purpuratum TaxID=1144873 RepID=A0A4R7BGF7_9NEIS|nr:calcium-binding protein [Paludibacterium purpuratum]TDR82806.1 hemolysin type calcium binding protein [Paludibacterium purpuratum]
MKTTHFHGSTAASSATQASRMKRSSLPATDSNGFDESGAHYFAYNYPRGVGDQIIIEREGEGAEDYLHLHDVTSNDVTVTRQGNDIILTVKPRHGNDGGTITITGMLDGETAGVEFISFSDGVQWTSRAEILRHLSTPTESDDTSPQTSRTKRSTDAATDGNENGDNDLSSGDDTDNILHGDQGNDTLKGGDGNDTYLYKRGDGSDIITEKDGEGFHDKLKFTDIRSDEVSISRQGNDVILTINGNGDTLALKDMLVGPSAGVESIQFSDTEWTSRREILGKLVTQAATDGADNLTGSDGLIGAGPHDLMQGRRGNDTMAGGTGNDTYRYKRGDGSDIIIEKDGEGFHDKVEFLDIQSDEVTVSRQGSDIILTIQTKQGGDGGTITIKGMLDGQHAGVESIKYTDVEWSSRREILGHLFTPSESDDTLSTTHGSRMKRSTGGEGMDDDSANHSPTAQESQDAHGGTTMLQTILTNETIASNDDAFSDDDVTWGASEYEELNRMLTSAETM